MSSILFFNLCFRIVLPENILDLLLSSVLKLGRAAPEPHPGNRQTALLKPPPKSTHSCATFSSSQLPISFPYK